MSLMRCFFGDRHNSLSGRQKHCPFVHLYESYESTRLLKGETASTLKRSVSFDDKLLGCVANFSNSVNSLCTA